MLKAVLIDDEKHCVESLELDIKRHCSEVEVLATCTSSKEGLQKIKALKPDVVFLDIEMPWMNGFELLELLQPLSFDVIFVTAYDTYAIQAFRVSAVDYLLKPIDKDSLLSAVKRVKKRKEEHSLEHLEDLLQQHFEGQSNRRISVPERDAHHFIELDDILYLESEGNYTRIYLDEQKNLFVSLTLKSMEEKISDEGFIRTHQSFLVNKDKIRKYVKTDGGYLVMSNGAMVPVARSKRGDVRDLVT